LGIAGGTLVTSATFYDHVHPDDRNELMRAIRQSAADLSLFREEFRLISSTGAIRWFRSDALARPLPNGDIMWDGIAVEITAERKSETDLAFLAFHDSLTGLCNRDLFKTALFKVISNPSEEEELAIFIIDLDSFQEINDSLGQEIGDDVLRVIGERLTKFTKDAKGTVARLGGDEFAVLLPSVLTTQPVIDLARKIHAELARPMQLMGQEIIIQACVGAAILNRTHEINDPADACAELVKQADLALLAAKREGRGSCLLYASDLDDRFQNRMALRQSLHNSILNEQLELHYQPFVDLASGRIIGAEALVRWNHPDLGLQRPDLFIPLAEKSGFIVQLGAWVINEAMRQSQAWRLQGFTTPRISMNVSSVQLQKPGFITTIEQAIASTGADPRYFELELTEGLLIEASTEILSILSALKALGFGITIDDFGTGNATFKYLRDFPIDKIKIDQVFVRQLVIDSSDAFIIHAMVALSRSLGVTIVAEGIETEMQREFLRREGCQVGQGYLFSMPLMAEDFGWMLQNHVRLPMFTTD
jgi:diguanylate cyclase (GGDEF)-like protein